MGFATFLNGRVLMLLFSCGQEFLSKWIAIQPVEQPAHQLFCIFLETLDIKIERMINLFDQQSRHYDDLRYMISYHGSI